MALLTKEERNQEIEALRNCLDELEFASAILPEGPWADQKGLLVELPGDEEIEWKAGEIPENARIAAAYLMQLDEEEDQLTNYLLFCFELPQTIGDATELKVLKLINELNQQIRMGCFYLDESRMEEVGRKVQYRLAVGASTDADFDEGLVGEAIIEMSLYYDLMEERLMEFFS